MEIIRHDTDALDDIDFLKLFHTLLSKLHVIFLCGLLFGLLAYGAVYLLITPKYMASTMLYVNNASTKENATTITQSDLYASSQLVNTYSAIITSESFLGNVIADADIDIEVEDLAEQLEIESVNDTEAFKVTVMNEDPKAAARIANAIADIAPSQIPAIVDGSSVKVIDYASIPTEIAKPSYRKAALIGLMLGLFISAIVILLREIMDTTIKSESDLEEWKLPILGVVPDFAEAKKKKSYGYSYGNQNAGR